MFTKKVAASLLIALGLMSSDAFSVEVEFDLTAPTSREGVKSEQWWWMTYDSPYYAKTYNYGSGADSIDLVVTGYSYNNAKKIERDYVGNYSAGTVGANLGLGVEVADSPDHSVDNKNGDYDMILLSFSTEVSLDAISAGWRGTANGGHNSNGKSKNSEASILAFTGANSNPQSFEGKVWQNLLSEGWENAGDARIMNLNQDTAVNTGGLVSRYWLVGAYNSNLGGTSGFSKNDDFFKLNGISVSVNPVPVPGSLLLFGAALLGFGTIRRKSLMKG